MDEKKIDDAIDIIKQLSSDHKNCNNNELKRKEEEFKQKVEMIEEKNSFQLEALKVASAEIVVDMTNKTDKLTQFSKNKVLENASLKKILSLEERVTQLEVEVKNLMEKDEKSTEKIDILLQNAEKFRNLYENQNKKIEALFAQVSNNSQQT